MWNSGTSRANYVLIIVEAFPQSRFTKATVVSVTSTIQRVSSVCKLPSSVLAMCASYYLTCQPCMQSTIQRVSHVCKLPSNVLALYAIYHLACQPCVQAIIQRVQPCLQATIERVSPVCKLPSSVLSPVCKISSSVLALYAIYHLAC